MMTSKSGFAKSLEDEVKKARFSEQQIIEILKLAEAGTKVADPVPQARDQPVDVLSMA